MNGILYIVATPIGNLEDITLRALRILKEADIIAAEDTRTTKKLLNHYDIHTSTISFHKFSDTAKLEKIIEMLLDGKNVALTSDAGTPCISDPGCELVSLAISRGIKVDTIPGACALISGFVLSGFNLQDGFTFLGFPPRKSGELNRFLLAAKDMEHPFCLYESPNRLLKTLLAIKDVLGDRNISVSREITKLFEETFRGSVTEVYEHFAAKEIRGEIALVVDRAEAVPNEQFSEEEIIAMLQGYISRGDSKRDAIKKTSEVTKQQKKIVYEIANKL